MADGIYIGMNAAAARAAQLDAIADNLANAHTPGFKAARPAFQSFLPGVREGAPDQRHTAAVATGTDLRPGTVQRTGRSLDVLPESGAFLAVRTPGGALAYTRDGSVHVDPAGTLHVSGGALVDEGGRAIVVPSGVEPAIGHDGMVRVGDTNVGKLASYALSGPVDRLGATLVAPATGGEARAAQSRFDVGVLELGNGGPLEQAIALVDAQRQFDSAMQAIQTYRRLDERLNELARVR